MATDRRAHAAARAVGAASSAPARSRPDVRPRAFADACALPGSDTSALAAPKKFYRAVTP